MKIKHNKKRNTAFVYESIVKEATVAILKGDNTGKDRAIKILRKHFAHGSVLHRHLDCYRSLYKNQSIEKEMSEKILREAKLASRLLDSEGLFIKQTDLINDVNKELSSEVFSNFVHKFNKKYNTGLLQEQKQLLNHYISSFSDNALSLKSFLNTEIGRLKEALQAALEVDAIKDDSAMVKKTTQIIEKLDSFYKEQISDTVLLTVLKTQALVQEIFDHGDKS